MGCMMLPIMSSGVCDLWVCVCVSMFVAELSDELGQQHGGHQAPAGPQRCDEGACTALRHGLVAHQTHLRHLW